MHVYTPIHSWKQQIFISSCCIGHCLFAIRSFHHPSPENCASCLSLPTMFQLDGQGEALARDRRLRSKEKPDYFFHPPLCFEHHFLQWFQLPIRQPLHPESLAVPTIVQPQPLILLTPSLPCVLRTLVVVAASCCH